MTIFRHARRQGSCVRHMSTCGKLTSWAIALHTSFFSFMNLLSLPSQLWGLGPLPPSRHTTTTTESSAAWDPPPVSPCAREEHREGLRLALALLVARPARLPVKR